MRAKFEVRVAQAADARPINRYIKDIYAEPGYLITRRDEYTFGPIQQRLRLARKLANAHETVLVAVDENGHLIGMLECWTDRRARICHSTTFAMSVHAGWRGQGVGRALLEEFIQWVRTHRVIERVELHVHEDNAHAIQLYQSLGFRLEGTRKEVVRYEDGRVVDDHIMALWPKRRG